jgi:hypothetical protein
MRARLRAPAAPPAQRFGLARFRLRAWPSPPLVVPWTLLAVNQESLRNTSSSADQTDGKGPKSLTFAAKQLQKVLQANAFILERKEITRQVEKISEEAKIWAKQGNQPLMDEITEKREAMLTFLHALKKDLPEAALSRLRT